MAWGLLALAGMLEIVWALALKQADGLTRFWPSVIGVSVAMLSLVLLGLALKHLPVGTAYAIWVGIGALAWLLSAHCCSASTCHRPSCCSWG